MTYNELNDYIKQLRLQGSDELNLFLIEKHRRIANPFAVFILTLIGVSLPPEGKGRYRNEYRIGLGLSFSYILFMQLPRSSRSKETWTYAGYVDPEYPVCSNSAVLYKLAPK